MELLCALCMWVAADPADVRPALTIINGQAVCLEHRKAASLGRNHRHAAVLAGAAL